ncbi:MAG TPA: hypothetical protein VFX24_13595 [Ktedonobacterales bacterium]|jgi:hypothetical protein|nr:hypothetical protein [Ktedonobacterales bacterium]
MLFSQRCTDVEALAMPHEAPEIEDVRAEHRAYATGTIFSSVAFLEATINEFFGGSSHSSDLRNQVFGEQGIKLIRTVWEHFLSDKSKYTTLEKYQLALTLTNANPFPEKDSRTPPQVGSYQDIQNLTTLRNALMHYKPLWESDPKREDRDVRRLKSMLHSRFSKSQNPLYDPRSHFLHVYLGSACAKWAIKASVTFTDDFFSRIGLPASYEYMRSKWSL